MKIAFLYYDALAPGGYPRDMRWLAGALVELGHEVSVLGRPGAHRDGLDGVRIVEVLGDWAPAAAEADIVHNFGLSRFDQLRTLYRMRSGIEHLVVSPLAHLMKEHVEISGWKKRPVYRITGLMLTARSSWAHYFSEREAAESGRYLPAKRSFIANVGVFPDVGDVPEARDDGDHLLFFGRNDVHQKGLDLLVAGYERAIADGLDVPLVIGGRPQGASNAFLTEAAERLNGRLRIVGPTDDAERTRLMSQARAFVFLSRWDGPPRPIREALALGIPLIVSPGTNMGELVADYEAGLQVGDVASVAAAMKLAGDDEVVTRWRSGAVRLRDASSWLSVAKDFEAGYERVLGR